VHLLRTGEVNAHLPTLLEKLDGPDYLPALIEAKVLGEHWGARRRAAPARSRTAGGRPRALTGGAAGRAGDE